MVSTPPAAGNETPTRLKRCIFNALQVSAVTRFRVNKFNDDSILIILSQSCIVFIISFHIVLLHAVEKFLLCKLQMLWNNNGTKAFTMLEK